MRKKTLGALTDDELHGRRVAVRVDFNVPLGPGGSVEDDTRIRRTLPTVRRLAAAGARSMLLSHLGRPGGEPDPSLSLAPAARRLSELLGTDVAFVDEPSGPAVREGVEGLEDGAAVVLENTRFHPGEASNAPDLAREWAALVDLYVNDAFGTAHRAHASTVGLAEAVREAGGQAVAGALLEEELRVLDEGLREPERPFLAVLGGAKISGKIDVVEALLPRVDRLAVGGAMANTFFRALGLEVGRSLVEEDRVAVARTLMERAGDRLLLPVDCVVGRRIEEDAATRTADRSEVGAEDRIGDVGPRTRELFAGEVEGARTIVWNGPMGVFEIDAFAGGTLAVARALARATEGGARTVVGGGDSAAAAERAGVASRLSHVSTGGGAALEVLAGNPLPAVEALSDAQVE